MPDPVPKVQRERVVTDTELTAIWQGCGAVGYPRACAAELILYIRAAKLPFSSRPDLCKPGNRKRDVASPAGIFGCDAMTDLRPEPDWRLFARRAPQCATEEEIKEALIQATVYCGIPAGLDAFKYADVVIKKASEL